jgi:hypothetical protein
VKFFRKTFFILLKEKSREGNESISSRLFLVYLYFFKDFQNNSESPGPSLVHDGGKQQADSG